MGEWESGGVGEWGNGGMGEWGNGGMGTVGFSAPAETAPRPLPPPWEKEERRNGFPSPAAGEGQG